MAISPCVQLVDAALDDVEHDEERRAVLLELWPLMAVPRVLDGELVQSELLLDPRQFAVIGILERDPYERARALQVRVDIRQRDVGDLLPVLVGYAVDQHRGALASA